MQQILPILDTFRPISLEEMDAVKLMTRIDKKYICHIDDLPAILEAAREEYQVLQIGEKRLMGYDSLYFDTPENQMYIKHHNRKRNRYKVRIRQYTNTSEFFLEVKYKKNTGVTEKVRQAVRPMDDLTDPEASAFVETHSPYTRDVLQPRLYSHFKRFTLVSVPRLERITIDTEPGWRFNGQSKELPYLVIMEVKSERFTNTEGFGWILREARIQRKRISKYCTGINLLYPEIKYNRFKIKMLHLRKLDKTQAYAHLFPHVT